MSKRKPKVGLLGLMFKLYDGIPELKPTMTEFAKELIKIITPFADVEFPGVCNKRSQVETAIANFESKNVDLLIVVLLTYAPSHIALPGLLKTKLPVLIFNTQKAYSIGSDIPPEVLTENHGMHGVQDLANVLLRSEREFYILTGHYKDKNTIEQLRNWCEAASVAKFMKHCRIGLLGYPMEQMGDFAIDETIFLAQIGVEVKRIPMKKLATIAANASDEEINKQIEFDKEHFEVDSEITRKEHEASSRLEWAIRKMLKGKNMHGFAAHFMAIAEDGRIDTLPFIAASKLMAEGYGYGGEGDVTSAAAVTMMQKLTGASNFTEMFTMDFGGNAVLMSHMGESNWKLARKDIPIRMVHSRLGLVPLNITPTLLVFSIKPGDVTLVSLTTLSNGKLKMIVTEGKVLDFPPINSLSTPHFKFAPEANLSEFLTRFSMEGGSHHQALAYGHLSEIIKKISKLLKLECTVI